MVLRNDAGELSIWRFGELGAGPYAVRLLAPPTLGVDAEGDGRLALWAALSNT